MNNSTCIKPHGFESPNDFFDCYRYFFINNIPVAIVEISFIALIALTNSLVIIKIAIFNKRPNKTIYDKIFLWLSSEYLITSLFAYPFFHIEELIGYWGFGETPSLIWAVYDNNMNTFVSLLVLYLTYARYRSIQSSVNYLKEPIFRFPNRFICFFWLFGAVIWSIVVYFSKTYEYTTHVSYEPNILQFFVNAVMWFFPLLGVYIIGGLIIYKLHDLKRMNKAKLRSNLSSHHSVFKMANDPTARFSIIIVAFLVQWTVPCLFMLVETFLAERIDSLILAFKWSTYTVSFTDPILILIFCL